MSLFSGQGRGGDEAKRSWIGVVYVVLILTLHVSEIKHKSVTNFQVKPLQTFSLLSIFTMQNEHGRGVSRAVGDSKVPEKVQEKAPQGLEESLPNKVPV